MAAEPPPIPPNSAPGGLAFYLEAGGRLWAMHTATPDAPPGEVERYAAADATLAGELAARFGEATQTVYDGDTGEAVARYTVTPE
jgi:hypothetical protein